MDPTKEVQAYKDAIRCGFTTVSRVIEQTGNGDDLEDIIIERAEELKLMHENDLYFDTDPERAADGSEQPEPAPAPSGASENQGTPAQGQDEYAYAYGINHNGVHI